MQAKREINAPAAAPAGISQAAYDLLVMSARYDHSPLYAEQLRRLLDRA